MNLQHTFKVLDEDVTVTTNEEGSYLLVEFGDVIIEESWGDCVSFGSELMLLSGAALESATNKILRKYGESAIRSFIELKAEE